MRQAAIMIAGQSVSEPLWHAFVQSVLAPVRWFKQRRRMVRLIDMDDHILADIGINRADVRYAMSLPMTVNAELVLQERALARSGAKRHGWRQS